MKTRNIILIIIAVIALFFIIKGVSKKPVAVDTDYQNVAFTTEAGETGLLMYHGDDNENAALVVNNITYQLKRTESASGTRYANEDESVVYWEHQGEATIEINGETTTVSTLEGADILNFTIAPQKQVCTTGAGETTCLVVNGELFYDDIEGFEFEPGTEYELTVARTTVENPAADQGSYHYRRVEVLKSTKQGAPQYVAPTVPAITPTPVEDEAGITGYTWKWVRTNQVNGGIITPTDSDAFIATWKADGTFGSTTDCNGLGGGYTLNGENITIGQLVSTKMFCENSSEVSYAAFLNDAATVSVDDESLTLTLKDGSTMEFIAVDEVEDIVVEEEEAPTIHPSWDTDGDGINDCENDGTCDDSVDYTQPKPEEETSTDEE